MVTYIVKVLIIEKQINKRKPAVRSKTKSCFGDSGTKSIKMEEKRPFEKNED